LFQFLEPISLFASAGIIIPIIIHLWNVRQGKILKVGSIALLQESDRQQARSIKLKDLLLLLLRCLLIILLAILLAKPQYQKSLTIQAEKGWIVVPKTELETAYKNYKPLIDSLTSAGYQFHYFEKGFAKEQLAQALQSANVITDTLATPYWQTLKALDKEVPAELPVYLFTSKELKRFTDNRPSVYMNLVWKTFAVEESVSSFLSDAYLSSAGPARVALAVSKPSATIQTFTDIFLQQLPPNFAVRQDEHTLFSYKDSLANKSEVELDTTILSVVIFTDRFANDANYLRAAINAIREFGKYRIKLSMVKNVADIPNECDWLFWLSEQAFSPQAPGKNVFLYEKGKEERGHSWLTITGKSIEEDNGIETMRFVRNAALQNSLRALWMDGFGNTMLSVDNIDEQRGKHVYHFYSRFNPMWNELVWSSHFPALMHELFYGKAENAVNVLDKRVIDANQLQPDFSNSERAQKDKFIQRIDLSKLFWLFAFLVFCVERFVALKTKKEVISGRG
jgi:hypothetical protein